MRRYVGRSRELHVASDKLTLNCTLQTTRAVGSCGSAPSRQFSFAPRNAGSSQPCQQILTADQLDADRGSWNLILSSKHKVSVSGLYCAGWDESVPGIAR